MYMHTYPTGIRIKSVFIRWLKLTLVRESSLKPHTLDEGSRSSVRTGSTQTEPAGSFGDQRVSDKQDVKNPSSLVLTPSGQSPYYTRDGVTTKHDLCDHIALDNRELTDTGSEEAKSYRGKQLVSLDYSAICTSLKSTIHSLNTP